MIRRMKTKRIIHGVLLVLGLSVLGLLFYYLMWLITDEEFREMLSQGWPFTSGMVLMDYAACCLRRCKACDRNTEW